MSNVIQRIPVKLHGAAGVRYSDNESLTFGVPFADRVLPEGALVHAVTGDGRSIPIQTDCMATWHKDLRFVKWLLVDMQADAVGDGETVWLEYPPAVETPALQTARGERMSSAADSPTPAITTTEANGLLTVDTGVLRLKLRTSFELWRHRECDSPIAGCQVKVADGWREVLHGDGILLYMKDQHGNLYTSRGVSPAPRVTVEEKGPLRVCVRIDGHLTSSQGIRFCPYRLRIHLYAGKMDLRVFHTFVFDQDPTRVELAAIGMKVMTHPGDRAVAAVGGEGQSAHWSRNSWHRRPQAESSCHDNTRKPLPEAGLSLLQTDDLHYAAQLNGVPFGVGGKAAGWAALGGSESSVVAVTRDFWQEYPKGFKIERDSLDVRIWPEDHAQPLSFLTPLCEPSINFHDTRDEEEVKRLLVENPTAPLWLSTFHARTEDEFRWVETMVNRHAQGRVASYNDVGTDNGIGAAKTTEVLLRFFDGPVANTAAASAAKMVQDPLAAVVDPTYLCGTGAVEHMLPAGDPRFADADAAMDDGHFEFCIMDPVERCRLYGMMRYGNLINNHGNSPDFLHHFYKDTEPHKILRFFGVYNNEARDHILVLWCHFLRTGNPKYLRPAQLAARATADVGFVHACPDDSDRIGVVHYHNLHVWSGVLCRSHSIVGGIMMDYYMTGNRRSLDVAIEAADQVVRVQNPAGILNCFYGNSLNREYVGPLSILLEAFQATWQERYGALAERSLAWLLRVARKPGHLPKDVYTVGPRGDEAIVSEQGLPAGTCGNHYNMYASALRLFPSRELKAFLVANADYWLWEVPRAGHFNLTYDSTVLCLAYDITGDPAYAARAMDLLSRYKAAKPEAQAKTIRNFVQYLMSGVLPRLMKTVALAMDRNPQVFAEQERSWRAQRDKLPDRIDDTDSPKAGEINMGIVSAEPFERAPECSDKIP